MSVGLLIVSHGQIGQELLDTAIALLGTSPLRCKALAVRIDNDTDATTSKLEAMYAELNQGEGVLVLTDMYGSTPSNLANRLAARPAVRVIAGINLPMLIRIMNYPDLNLNELANKAVSGGQTGVLACSSS